MELIQFDILDTGSSNNFLYFSLTCGFNIHPASGKNAYEKFMYIRSVISLGAEIQDDIAIRMYSNSADFGLTQWPSDNDDVVIYQYLFSVSAHNNNWTAETLKAALGSAPIPSYMKPKAGYLSLLWNKSILNGMKFHIHNGTSFDPLIASNLIFSKDAPVSGDGKDGQVWVVPDSTSRFLTYYLNTNNTWTNITQYVTVGDTEPTDEKYWFEITGMECRIGSGTKEIYNPETYSILYDNVTDPDTISIFNSTRGSYFRKNVNGSWVTAYIDGNYVLDEYSWFSTNDTINDDAFTFTEGASALAGANLEGGSGAVDIYNYNTDAGNFIGTATKLVFVDGDQKAWRGSEEGTIMVGTAPDFRSHFMTADGSNGNQSISPAATILSYIPDLTEIAASGGTWEQSVQPALTTDVLNFATPGECTGFGGNSSLTATIFNSAGLQIAKAEILNITGNASVNDTSTGDIINLKATGYTSDSSTFAAKIEVRVDNTKIYGGESGRIKVEIKHKSDTGADDGVTRTFTQEYFYDNDPTTPEVTGLVGFAANATKVTKWLSGVEYYTTGQVFDMSVTDIADMNKDTAAVTGNLLWDTKALPITNITSDRTAPEFSGLTPQWSAMCSWSKASSIDVANSIFVGSQQMSISVKDNWNVNMTNVSTGNLLVNTVAPTSTAVSESFTDETFRRNADWSVWDSTVEISNGDGIVYNSKLQFPQGIMSTTTPQVNVSNLTAFGPVGPNYSGFTSPSIDYYREFTFTNATKEYANLQITLTGEFGSHADLIAAMAAGDVELFMHKKADSTQTFPNGTANALWLHKPYRSPTFDNGATQVAENAGIQLPTSSGSTVNMTFAGYALKEGFWLHVRVNNPLVKLTSITIIE